MNIYRVSTFVMHLNYANEHHSIECDIANLSCYRVEGNKPRLTPLVTGIIPWEVGPSI